jgi:hypothetical protein
MFVPIVEKSLMWPTHILPTNSTTVRRLCSRSHTPKERPAARIPERRTWCDSKTILASNRGTDLTVAGPVARRRSKTRIVKALDKDRNRRYASPGWHGQCCCQSSPNRLCKEYNATAVESLYQRRFSRSFLEKQVMAEDKLRRYLAHDLLLLSDYPVRRRYDFDLSP